MPLRPPLGLVARALVLVVAGAGVGLGANAVRTGGVPLRTWQAPVACGAGEETSAPTEMSPADVAPLCARTDVAIADTRSPAKYTEGHVAGALHLPCEADGKLVDDAYSRLGGAHMVIVYGDDTADARPVAQRLSHDLHGIAVVVLRGGFPAWSRAGLACQSGACDLCEANAH